VRILCVFGRYQYGSIARGESTEYFSFIPALSVLGHEVHLFDSWDKSAFGNYAELNAALVEHCRCIRPDVILWVALTVEVWIETLDFIRNALSIRIIHWAPDDSWKFLQHSKFVAPHVDLCVTTYPDYLLRYLSLGATAINSGWGVPESWRGEVLPAANCAYDVTFVGAAQAHRIAMVESLTRRGIRVQCFGFGWPSGPIPQEAIPEIFRQSRISLNFANSSGLNQVKARVFEVTGAGGFLLSETANGLDLVFSANQEIAAFSAVDECEHQIRYFLNNPIRRDNIARAGNERTNTQYTYVARLRSVLKALPSARKVDIGMTSDFSSITALHTRPKILIWTASVITIIGQYLFGKARGTRFARRLCFEISWRVAGTRTFRARGLVGRMFYV